MNTVLKSVVGSATGLAMVSALALQASAQDLQSVSLRLAYTAVGVDAPIFMAYCQGYFAEEGIALDIVDGTGSTSTIQAVGNGSFNIGIAGLGALAQAAATSGFDDIIAVAGLVQKDPSSIIALKGSGIIEPKDIEGKRFATDAGNLVDGMITAFAEANGIDMDTVQLIVTEADRQALLSGDADFINGWAPTDGGQINRISEIEDPIVFADYGVNILGSSVIVDTDYLAENEQIVRGFLAALTRGYADVLADPAAALDCFMEQRPDSNAETIASEIEAMEDYRRTANSADLPFGHVHPDDLVQTISLLEQYSGMPVGVVSPEMLYTDAYLPAE